MDDQPAWVSVNNWPPAQPAGTSCADGFVNGYQTPLGASSAVSRVTCESHERVVVLVTVLR
jgi:hypothetical protein